MSKAIKKSKTPFGGKKFKIQSVDIEVFPMGLRHMPVFMSRAGSILSLVMSKMKDLKIDKEVSNQDLKSTLSQVIPVLMSTCLDLFYECCNATGKDLETDEEYDCSEYLADLPHYEMVEVLQHWVEESFGSMGKLRPWIQLIESLVSKTTGEKMDLLSLLSKGSSPEEPPITNSSS